MDTLTAVIVGGIVGHWFGWPGIILAGLVVYALN